MKTRFLILLALLSLGVSGVAHAGHGKGPSAMEQLFKQMAGELELTKDQKKAILVGFTAKKPELDALRGKIKATRKELMKLLDADAPDEALVMATIDELGALNLQESKLRVGGLVLIHEVLTDEQRATFVTMKTTIFTSLEARFAKFAKDVEEAQSSGPGPDGEVGSPWGKSKKGKPWKKGKKGKKKLEPMEKLFLGGMGPLLGRKAIKPYMMIALADELGVDEETKAAMEQILETSKTTRKQLHKELHQHMAAMFALWKEPMPDEAALMVELDSLGTIGTTLAKTGMGAILAVRALLTSEQRAILEKKRVELMNKLGKPFWKGPGGGGASPPKPGAAPVGPPPGPPGVGP